MRSTHTCPLHFVKTEGNLPPLEKDMEWILASASPRRRELLAELIEEFEVCPSKGEERVEGTPAPEELVKILATQKAKEVASLERAKGKAVLGSDTVVAIDGEVLGKPKDEADAFRMLTALSGRVHQVYTGVCILYPSGEGRKMRVEADCTQVVFEELNADMVWAYIKTGSPMDKAGAYGIQDGLPVEYIRGSYDNVVGLPTELLLRLLNDER